MTLTIQMPKKLAKDVKHVHLDKGSKNNVDPEFHMEHLQDASLVCTMRHIVIKMTLPTVNLAISVGLKLSYRNAPFGKTVGVQLHVGQGISWILLLMNVKLYLKIKQLLQSLLQEIQPMSLQVRWQLQIQSLQVLLHPQSACRELPLAIQPQQIPALG